MSTRPTADDFLRISPKIRVLPIVHGSGDCAIRVREEMLARAYDCLAVPLPGSFQAEVEAAIEQLPTISVVAQLDVDRPRMRRATRGWVSATSRSTRARAVIAALRLAMGERMARAFIDLETPRFQASTAHFPDPYALKLVSPEGFAAAVLPAIPPPERRSARAADRLHGRPASAAGSGAPGDPAGLLADRLAVDPGRYTGKVEVEEPSPFFAPMQTFGVDPKTLIFLTGELPFLTGLYERGGAS